MKLARTRFAPPLSLTVALAVVAVFTLSSFAASDVTSGVEPQDCSGTLTVTKGAVTINGNAVQSGATVMTGSAIEISSGGAAAIDMGALGRITMEGGSRATLTCDANTVHLQTDLSSVEIEVTRGQVTVGSTVLTDGKGKQFSGPVEAVATKGSDFMLALDPPQAGGGGGGGLKGPGLIGIIALVGAGAGIATAIALGDEGHNPVAPMPSPVVP